MMTAGGLRGDYRVICPAVFCVKEVQLDLVRRDLRILESQGFSEKRNDQKGRVRWKKRTVCAILKQADLTGGREDES